MSPDERVVTQVVLGGANCPWCLNETLERLRHEPGVCSVEASAAGQCVRIEHAGLSDERLLDVIRGHLRGSVTWSTEQVMVEVEPRVASLHCTHRPDGSHRTDG